MFQWWSRLHVLRPALALALAAGFLATPVGIAHEERSGFDPCDAPAAWQDPGGPRLGPEAGFDRHAHCFTCHWFQSLRSALVGSGIVVPDSRAASPVAPLASTRVAALAVASAGARAPPA